MKYGLVGARLGHSFSREIHARLGNPDYELCGNATVEWYDCVNGEKTDPDYHSAIWVPVRRRRQ